MPAPEKDDFHDLSVDELFSDISFSKETIKSDDERAIKTSRICRLHQTPIYEMNGYDNGLMLSHSDSFYAFERIAEFSEGCPNHSPSGVAWIAPLSSGEHSKPSSIDYCCACDHVYKVASERFFDLPEAEQERWVIYSRSTMWEVSSGRN